MEDIIELPNGDEAHKIGVEVGELGVSDNEIEEGQLVSKTNEDIIIDEASRCEIVVSEKNDSIVQKDGVDLPSEIDSPRFDTGSKAGVKRMRMTCEEQQPSVHVKYYGLSRQSKQKLEELLRQWSEWHVKNPSEILDQNGGLETGEGIYFPALDIGTEKTSAVSFWMENEIRKPENNDYMVEDGSVPLYDRGFALGSSDGSNNLEGGSELLDVPRCFNCGSYSHALKECQKPRNNAAVNSSRKQLKSKRNQTSGIMRNAARYYQDSPSGKYEGLRPGVLHPETRQLLGLGEFDPPPWLNRMRDIGYPPGYLEPEDEDLPSGIIIYADEETKDDKEEGKEEGEILEADQVKPRQKKSVLFPGINAPIPNNADERVWAIGSSNPDRHRNGNFHSNYSESNNSRGRYRDHNNNTRDFKDDDLFGSESAPRYPPRYSERDFNTPSQSSRRNGSGLRSPNGGRPNRSDALDSEDSLASRLYSSYSYNSSGRDFVNGQADYSSRGRDRDDRYRRGR